MARFFAFVLLIFLLISLCATKDRLWFRTVHPPSHIHSFDASFPNPELSNQIIYVDKDFPMGEDQLLSDAAEEWTFATKGMVQFTFVWDYAIDDKTFEDKPYRNTVIKTYSDVHFVTYVDSTLEKGKIALAFLHRPDKHWPYWYMGMVQDRLVQDRLDHDIQIKSVFEHELGHAIGLEHQDDEVSIMNSSADDRYGCLTKHDLLQFCDRYQCNVDAMNYCIPHSQMILASRNNP